MKKIPKQFTASGCIFKKIEKEEIIFYLEDDKNVILTLTKEDIKISQKYEELISNGVCFLNIGHYKSVNGLLQSFLLKIKEKKMYNSEETLETLIFYVGVLKEK